MSLNTAPDIAPHYDTDTTDTVAASARHQSTLKLNTRKINALAHPDSVISQINSGTTAQLPDNFTDIAQLSVIFVIQQRQPEHSLSHTRI